MDLNVFLERIPQSVLLTSLSLDAAKQFLLRWSAHLLQCSQEVVENHPDYFCVRPVNKMRQISVDAVRELSRNVFSSPHRSDRKVFVIYEADRLPRAAANAFLKTLEEPPLDTSLFLLTTRPYDLLPTLRSRCWWISIPVSMPHHPCDEVQSWMQTFKRYVEQYLQGNEVSLMQIYGLLYLFQSYVEVETQKMQPSESEYLNSEEVLAIKAGIEKRCVQQFFLAVEESLGEIFRCNQVLEKMYLYPEWVQNLEKAFELTEANLSAASALEAFLLKLCSYREI
jgi:DNA polymerase-3 subunit delta'